MALPEHGPAVQFRQLVEDTAEIRLLAKIICCDVELLRAADPRTEWYQKIQRELDTAVAKLDTLTKVVKRTLSGAAVRLAKHEQEWEERYFRAEARFREDVADLSITGLIDGFDPHGCFVYLLFGDDPQVPLYVGKSTNVLSRLGSHMGNGDRRYRVRSIKLVRCRTGTAMDQTEARLIAKFQPVLNVAGIRPSDGISA